jgi:hypothetical protein
VVADVYSSEPGALETDEKIDTVTGIEPVPMPYKPSSTELRESWDDDPVLKPWAIQFKATLLCFPRSVFVL